MELNIPQILIPKHMELKDPADNKFGLFGEFQIIKKRKGIVIQELKFKNIITDVGLQRLASYAEGIVSRIIYLHLGTGTSIPVSTDTTLQSRGYSAGSGITRYSQGSGNDWWTEVQWDLGLSVANGNWTELGAGWLNSSPYTVFCRSLFKDENGNPITVEKTSSDTLTVIYRLHLNRASDTPFSSIVSVAGLGDISVESLMPDYGLQHLHDPVCFFPDSTNKYCYLGSNNNPLNPMMAVGNYGFCRSGFPDYASLHSIQAYVPGTMYRDYVTEWPASIVGNIGEASLAINQSFNYGYCSHIAMRFNPVIPKDNTKKFRINWRITFNRLL